MTSTHRIKLVSPNFFLLIIFIWIQKASSTGLKDEVNLPDADVKKPLVGIYSLYRKSLTWADAQMYCETHEGHLATFTKIEDLKSVIEKIFETSDKVTTEYLSGAKTHEFGLDRRYWIGLTDLVSGEGNWVWAGKGLPLTYQTMWYPGQPDHIDKTGKYIGRPEHCVALWNPIFHKGDRRHSLVDQECKRQYYFLCENDPDKIAVQKKYKEQNPHHSDTGKSGRGIYFTMNERPRKHNAHSQGSGQQAALGRSIQFAGSKPQRDGDAWKKLPGFSDLFEQSSSRENSLWDEEPKNSRSKPSSTSYRHPTTSRNSGKAAKTELEAIFGQ